MFEGLDSGGFRAADDDLGVFVMVGAGIQAHLCWNVRHRENRSRADSTLGQWRAQRGPYRKSVIADPRFVDRAEGGYRLGDDSPALESGFERWDLSLARRRRGSTRTAHLPPMPGAFE